VELFTGKQPKLADIKRMLQAVKAQIVASIGALDDQGRRGQQPAAPHRT
jgi:hypothetical protein